MEWASEGYSTYMMMRDIIKADDITAGKAAIKRIKDVGGPDVVNVLRLLPCRENDIFLYALDSSNEVVHFLESLCWIVNNNGQWETTFGGWFHCSSK